MATSSGKTLFGGKLYTDPITMHYTWECPNCKNMWIYHGSSSERDLYMEIGNHYHSCSMTMGDPTGNAMTAWQQSQAQQIGAQNGNWNSPTSIYGNPLNSTYNSAGAVPSISEAGINSLLNSLSNFSNKTKPKPLENTGIKVGELIGWRIWFLKGEYLLSYSADRIWAPNEAMVGIPGDYDSKGIWAFKEKSRAVEKMLNQKSTTILGSIKLWGKVIEHELGYRAEFARVISIEDVYNGDKKIIKQLQEKYLSRSEASPLG